MNREMADPLTRKVHTEITLLQVLENRIFWARWVTQIGALGCSLWLVSRVFEAWGFLAAAIAFAALSAIYNFGASLMFTIAASVICFYFNSAGMWLPVLSYV